MKLQQTPNGRGDWQDALDSGLTRRLAGMMVQPGIIKPYPAQRIYSSSRRMLQRGIEPVLPTRWQGYLDSLPFTRSGPVYLQRLPAELLHRDSGRVSTPAPMIQKQPVPAGTVTVRPPGMAAKRLSRRSETNFSPGPAEKTSKPAATRPVGRPTQKSPIPMEGLMPPIILRKTAQSASVPRSDPLPLSGDGASGPVRRAIIDNAREEAAQTSRSSTVVLPAGIIKSTGMIPSLQKKPPRQTGPDKRPSSIALSSGQNKKNIQPNMPLAQADGFDKFVSSEKVDRSDTGSGILPQFSSISAAGSVNVKRSTEVSGAKTASAGTQNPAAPILQRRINQAAPQASTKIKASAEASGEKTASARTPGSAAPILQRRINQAAPQSPIKIKPLAEASGEKTASARTPGSAAPILQRRINQTAPQSPIKIKPLAEASGAKTASARTPGSAAPILQRRIDRAFFQASSVPADPKQPVPIVKAAADLPGKGTASPAVMTVRMNQALQASGSGGSVASPVTAVPASAVNLSAAPSRSPADGLSRKMPLSIVKTPPGLNPSSGERPRIEPKGHEIQRQIPPTRRVFLQRSIAPSDNHQPSLPSAALPPTMDIPNIQMQTAPFTGAPAQNLPDDSGPPDIQGIGGDDEPNLDELTDRIWHRLMRRLAIEKERRGTFSWR